MSDLPRSIVHQNLGNDVWLTQVSRNSRHFDTGTNRHLCETFRYQDKSAPGQFGTSIRQIGTSKRQIGTFLIMSVPEKIPIMRTILLHCIQLSSDIVKLKEVFLPHPYYHVSGLLLKIFSIWIAHALGSGMDSKNNKNPYTVIFFSLHV